MVYSYLITIKTLATSGGRGGGEASLLFFENRKIVPWFCKNSALILEKSVLFVCTYGLTAHLKCSFKNILEKQHQNFPCFLCVSYMKRLSKHPYSEKQPLPRKIPGCAPETVNWKSNQFAKV